MKFLALFFGSVCVLSLCAHARYTFNQGQKNDPMALIRLLTFGGSTPDPKLKEGVINWIKDQIDPELLKTWYGLSDTDRMCVQRSLILAKEKIDQQRPEEAMEFIENYCPNAASAAEKVYKGLHEYAKKVTDWSEGFLEDLPESIRSPMAKFGKRSRWNALIKDREQKDKNMVEMLDAIEEVLTAPEEDRKALADKHAWLAPFVNGNLHADTVKLVEVAKKIMKNEEVDNKDEIPKLLSRWLKAIKGELMSYFETRERPRTDLPEDINTKFTQEVGVLYDLVYSVYAEPFIRLMEMGNSGEENSDELE